MQYTIVFVSDKKQFQILKSSKKSRKVPYGRLVARVAWVTAANNFDRIAPKSDHRVALKLTITKTTISPPTQHLHTLFSKYGEIYCLCFSRYQKSGAWVVRRRT